MNLLTLLCLVLLNLIINAERQPQDLNDDALAELEVLRETVNGAITLGHNQMDTLLYNSMNYLRNIWAETGIELDERWNELVTDLNTLKELAGSNIDDCLMNNEEIINNLPLQSQEKINDCVTPFVAYINRLRTDAVYKMRDFYSEVENYAAEIQICDEEVMCLSEVLTNMDTALVQIPQAISLEVELARTYIMETNLVFDSCMDVALYQIGNIGQDALNAITTCVNDKS